MNLWMAFLSARDQFPRLPDLSTTYSGWRPGRAPAVDVYLPSAPRGPSVVIVHGGGFVVGSRTMPAVLSLATRLVEDGIAVVTFDYRTFFRGGRFAEAVQDARAAARWWHREAHQHGCDPTQIAVLGLSAGAALALSTVQAESEVPWAGAIGIYGVYDFANPPGWAGPLGMRLLLRSGDPSAWARQSVLNTYHSPTPTLLLHGEADGLVPVRQSIDLAERRQRDGQPVQLVTYPDEPHAFLADPSRLAWSAGYQEIAKFLTQRNGDLRLLEDL